MIERQHCKPSLFWASGQRGPVELLRSREGLTAIEFAMIAPVLMLLLIGTLDMTQMVYANAMLRGAVEQAARSSSLETGDTQEADAKVEKIMKPILPGVLVISSRISYYDFADIGRPEKWEDRDLDGTCNNGEPYTDENGNGSWNSDVGVSGNGGAGDVVIYAVKAKYLPAFKVPFDGGGIFDRTLSATAVRKNQPFAKQEEYGTRAGVCD